VTADVAVAQYRLSQQSAELEQVSLALLQRGAPQTRPSQPPEQQSPSPVQSAPSMRQPAAHLPETQVNPEQQPAGSLQACPVDPHWQAFSAHSFEQHSPEAAHLSPPCLQRPAPPLPDLHATSCAQSISAAAANNHRRLPSPDRSSGRIARMVRVPESDDQRRKISSRNRLVRPGPLRTGPKSRTGCQTPGSGGPGGVSVLASLADSCSARPTRLLRQATPSSA
jgi:hypothetical protein